MRCSAAVRRRSGCVPHWPNARRRLLPVLDDVATDAHSLLDARYVRREHPGGSSCGTSTGTSRVGAAASPGGSRRWDTYPVSRGLGRVQRAVLAALHGHRAGGSHKPGELGGAYTPGELSGTDKPSDLDGAHKSGELAGAHKTGELTGTHASGELGGGNSQ